MSIFEQIKIGSSFDAKGFKQAETATQKLNSSVKSLARTFGVAFGTAAVVAYGKASVKAFIEDDNAARSLGITLKNLGLETGNTSAYVNEMISNLEKQTGVLDDQLRPAMDRLLRATNSVSKATSLLNLALDISAGTGKDLTAVSQGLQKAFLGNNASLGRLGVGLSKAELTSSSFEEIQIRLSELFAGQASSAAESYAGQLNKLTIAGNNAKEVIGKGIIQALTESSGSFNAAQSDIEKYSEAISDLIVEFGRFFRLSNAVPSIFELLTDPVTAIKNFNKVADEIDRLRAKDNAAAMGKNPIQSGSYLKNQKAVTKLTQEQSKAQAKILADKKLSAAVDKANLALAKGTDVFDLDKIQFNAALINQAELLGKTTNAAQILQIANDTARLNVKRSILALEDAIAAKDEAAIIAATNKLNADLKVLGALGMQNIKLQDIKSILEGLTPKDLINQANLDEALRKIKEMLDLLAKMNQPAAGGGGGGGGGDNNPFKDQPVLDALTGNESIDAILEYSDAVTTLANAMADVIEQQNAAAVSSFANSSLASYQADYIASVMERNRERFGSSGQGTQITIVDKTSGLVQVVQDAIIQNNKYGNALVTAGSL
jgi:hypothetical protein